MGSSSNDFAKQFSQKMRTPLDEAVDTIIEAAQIKGREKDGRTDSDVPGKRMENDNLHTAFYQVHGAEAGQDFSSAQVSHFFFVPMQDIGWRTSSWSRSFKYIRTTKRSC